MMFIFSTSLGCLKCNCIGTIECAYITIFNFYLSLGVITKRPSKQSQLWRYKKIRVQLRDTLFLYFILQTAKFALIFFYISVLVFFGVVVVVCIHLIFCV